MRRLLILAVFALALLLPMRALAGAMNSEDHLIRITEGESFDADAQMFVYPVPGTEAQIRCTAADGMYVSEGVTLLADPGVRLVVTRGGEEVVPDEEGRLTDQGDYLVFSEGTESPLFSFSVLGRATSKKGDYVVPQGFRILHVDRDGELGSWTGDRVSLSREGAYHIVTYCEAADRQYELDVTADHTPPEVVLSGVDEKGFASGPVELIGLSGDDSFRVYRDGMQEETGTVLRKSGSYEVILRDAAGNESVRRFTILVYFAGGGRRAALVACLLIAAAVYALYRYRAGWRVR
ncbi:MAG: hypothetical protein IKS07_10955 [Lachnospiraceae bacterium]|nr:hypothetical protein [Lachnospiraceae bacterium]